MKRTAFVVLALVMIVSLGSCSYLKPKGKLPKSKFIKEEWKAINHSDWPMFHHDVLHTGFNPKEKTLKPPLRVKWKTKKGGATVAPAVAQGIVYIEGFERVENVDSLIAIDAKTGKRLWKFLAQGPILSSPAIHKGTAYIGSNDHNLYALDAKTGRKKWSYDAGSWVESPPIVFNNKIYFGSLRYTVRALDENSAQQIWSYKTADWVVCSPTLANRMVYFGDGNGRVYAADRETGQRLWVFKTNDRINASLSS